MSATRAYVYGLVTMALLMSVGGVGVVSADGGQTDLIHACVLAEGGPNLRIMGANDDCDPGTTPLHWSGDAFQPDEVIPPPPAPEDPAVGTETIEGLGHIATQLQVVERKVDSLALAVHVALQNIAKTELNTVITAKVIALNPRVFSSNRSRRYSGTDRAREP